MRRKNPKAEHQSQADRHQEKRVVLGTSQGPLVPNSPHSLLRNQDLPWLLISLS